MPIRVFLADDHAVVRDGLRLLLETKGDITVVGEASDGRKTVKQVQKLSPDVVIMDISMPELNGIEATQQICKACPDTRIIILSIHATTEHTARSLKAGAKGYLLKESAGQEVVDAVRTLHSGQQYLSRQIADTVVEFSIFKKDGTLGINPIDSLSAREREVLQLVVEGKTSAEIAKTLHLSPKTVETYRSRLMKKLGTHEITSLVKFAIEHGLTPLK
ncbi:MAG: DNA-binding response regulator [Nitrospirae bacterium RBG_13_39_12]|nr:MAG: DNA-binding response regulator [Nitrospirae bacterium RBG_13_39_12]